MARRGLFVSFEGLDGSGKTTQIERLAERLRSSGIEPVLTREPGGTRAGQAVRAILLDSANDDLDPAAELWLNFAARVQHLSEVIVPALEQGRVVISDRFADASVAYQGYGRELGAELVNRLRDLACGGVEPDLTIWLDLDPEAALARARSRNASQEADEGRMELEREDFFLRVRQGYADLHASFPGRIRRVDAGGTEEQVAQRVSEAVRPALEGRGREG